MARQRATGPRSGFCHTEMCDLLDAVKRASFQSAHRSDSSRPASCPIKSSSEGQTYRWGDEKVEPRPSAIV